MLTISFLTSNNKKWKEFKRFFENYPYILKRNTLDADYVLSEETNLKYNKNNSFGEIISVLQIKEKNNKISIFISTQKVIVSEIKHKWWDKDVINIETLKTIHQLNKKGFKNIPRQQNFSKFIKKFYYKDYNFNHMKNNFKENFNFGPEKVWLFYNNQLNKLNVKLSDNLLNLIKNGCLKTPGIRKPLNNRLKNYWFPGLNAGIPAVPKDDFIHELTFSLHDVFHQLFPDPIWDGKSSAKSYVIPRMMSEAITMVLSDYYFINEIYEKYPEYNFEKRKIFKVFKEMEKNGATLFDMIKANINFAIKGDLKGFERFGVPEKILLPFVEKYKVFFVEDYKWTIQNFKNMSKKKKQFKQFSKIKVKHHKDTTFFEKMKYKEMINYFIKQIKKYQKTQKREINETIKAFFKGNYFLFLDYDIFPEIGKLYLKAFEKNEWEACKFYYKLMLKKLYKTKIINEDDFNTFKDIYPIFKPMYVFYERTRKKENMTLETLRNYYKTLKKGRI